MYRGHTHARAISSQNSSACWLSDWLAGWLDWAAAAIAEIARNAAGLSHFGTQERARNKRGMPLLFHPSFSLDR